jgi:glycosyltransferase involved in cell wall biosynthesis
LETIDYFLVLLAGVVAAPVAVFALEGVAAISLKLENQPFHATGRPRVAVLVPAHNESAGIMPTIADIRAQLNHGDRLIIVADNCSDNTARVAVVAGAEVVERNDLSRIGKGYALDFGIRHLSADPPAIVVVIDADCRVLAGTIDRLAAICASTQRPAQALDLMKAPEHSPINYRVAEFAWRIKNWVRPLGLRTLGLPCQLMGTGMAFPWGLLSSINLASSEIVEDLKLGLDFALAGSPPIFCPDAAVTSEFPASSEAAGLQRQRWEHGHLGMILKAAPHLIWRALLKHNLSLLVLVLDLAVPPLVILSLITVATMVITSAAYLIGFSSTALIVSIVSSTAFLVAVMLSWSRYGRDLLPPNSFWAVAHYVLAKFSLYQRMMSGGPAQWNRTDRQKK